jgi:DNA-binding transcriptional LysR family regulator
MRVTLRQLAVFEATARTGSVRKAAEEIAMSQAAASMSLRDLEGALDAALFERRGKRLILNERGRRFQPKVKNILHQVVELEGRDETDDELSGELVVGATQTIGNYILPGICGRFAREHEGVSINLKLGHSADILDMVENLSVDVGFVELPRHRPRLKLTPWMQDRLVFVAAPGHALARKPRVTLKELRDSTWILGSLIGIARSEIARHLTSPRVGMETTSMEAIKRAVATSGGVGYASEHAVTSELADGTLVELRLAGSPLIRTFSIATRKDAYLSQLQRSFIAAVTERRSSRSEIRNKSNL